MRANEEATSSTVRVSFSRASLNPAAGDEEFALHVSGLANSKQIELACSRNPEERRLDLCRESLSKRKRIRAIARRVIFSLQTTIRPGANYYGGGTFVIGLQLIMVNLLVGVFRRIREFYILWDLENPVQDFLIVGLALKF